MDDLHLRERVRYVGNGGLPRLGTVVGFDSERLREYTVEWESEDGLPKVRADYERRELERVEDRGATMRRGRDFLAGAMIAQEKERGVDKIGTLAQAFAYDESSGERREPPSIAMIERGFAHVVEQLKAERAWVMRARELVRDAPAAFDAEELLALAQHLDAIARGTDERERTFRQRLRLCLRSFLAGNP